MCLKLIIEQQMCLKVESLSLKSRNLRLSVSTFEARTAKIKSQSQTWTNQQKSPSQYYLCSGAKVFVVKKS